MRSETGALRTAALTLALSQGERERRWPLSQREKDRRWALSHWEREIVVG